MTRRPDAEGPADDAVKFPLSDAGNADYFANEADGRLAFDHTDEQWYEFNGHWRLDTVQRVIERAIAAMRKRAQDAAIIADTEARRRALIWGLKSEGRRQITDMLALAHPTIRADGSNWDANKLLMGVDNGAIDLDPVRFRAGTTFDCI